MWYVGSKKQRGGRRCGMVGKQKQRGGKKNNGGSKKQRGVYKKQETAWWISKCISRINNERWIWRLWNGSSV